MEGEHLTGNYRVRVIRPALDDAWRLCHKMSDFIEIRRHALKLRYWPQANPEDEAGLVLDLDWSWVKSLPRMNVGELRIHDTIAGNDNLRILFFRGDADVRLPLLMIWVIRVLQKKRDDFSKNELIIFKARRTLVMERFYER